MGAVIETSCCIAGGGPAGMMLGYLLARAGVDVIVLEKHKDFLRDFRGDTVHPSTLELFQELGLIEEFLRLPHERAERLGGYVGRDYVQIADFSRLPTHAKYIALVPQWDLLNFIAERGRNYPGFRLIMEGEVTDLILEGGTVKGVRAKSPDGELEIRAPVTIGCDGRHSTVRERAGFAVKDLGAPLDVFWFRLPHTSGERGETMARFAAGALFVQIFRGAYWQCAFVIPKGSANAVRERGLEAFRNRLAEIAPPFADQVGTLTDWDQIKLLTVAVDRLETWHRDGLLCIGDAAHAMSPVGGIGINLAIQDAVAAANLLWRPLRDRTCSRDDLARVEHRREWPTKVTQLMQVQIQNRIIAPTLSSAQPLKAPWILRHLKDIPVLRDLPARAVGLGVRPEHIETPDISSGQ